MPFTFTSLTMIQNEADVLEHFVRANLRFMDHMFIVSNPSSDGSREVLDRLLFEKQPITVWTTDINNYSQGEVLSWFTLYLRDALRPDFLFLLDADEFILSSSRASLANAVSALPPGEVGKLGWLTFIPPGVTETEDVRSVDFTERLEEEIHPFSKPVIPSTVEIHASNPLPHGAHSVLDRRSHELPASTLPGVELAHLPVRSLNQVREKAAATPLARALSHGTEWVGRESYQYAAIWERLKHGPVPDMRDLALCYLDHPEGTSRPSVVPDGRLHADAPRLVYDTRKLATADPYVRLVERLISTAFRSNDPVDPLREELGKRIEKADEICEELPPGAFSVHQHAESLKCDWPPFEQMISRFSPRRLLDLGCGLGAYLHLAKRKGIAVTGVDGSPWSRLHFLNEDEYVQHDLSSGPPDMAGTFDTSMCVEVLEHLPEGAGLDIVDWLARRTDETIVFSAARPGQPGHQHITCREPDFWLQRFKENGWTVDAPATASLRLLSSLHWFRCNLFVLRKQADTDADGLAHLLSLPHPVAAWPDYGPGSKLIGFPGSLRRFSLDGSVFPRDYPHRVASDRAVMEKKLQEALAAIGLAEASLHEKDRRITQLGARLGLLESEVSARRSRVAEKIDEWDYRVHLLISRISPSRSMRAKFADAARRRFRERYGRE